MREGEEDEGESYERRRLNMVNMYGVCVASDIIRGRKGVRRRRRGERNVARLSGIYLSSVIPNRTISYSERGRERGGEGDDKQQNIPFFFSMCFINLNE